jgi:hypothetical protein
VKIDPVKSAIYLRPSRNYCPLFYIFHPVVINIDREVVHINLLCESLIKICIATATLYLWAHIISTAIFSKLIFRSA